MKKMNVWGLALVSSFFLMASCQNDDTAEKASVRFYLTDAPAGYDAVNIDIQSIEIHTDEGGWVTHELEVPGVYNLLEYASGVDTLLLSADMDPGTISQIRLILGSNNSIVVDGVTYPLETPSAEESGLKLNVHYDLEPGVVYTYWLDFDAEQSIVEQGSGDYSLKPVIRVYTEAASGAIAGSIAPIDGAIYVAAISGSDTVGTYITDAGTFLIAGLEPGTYSVSFGAGLGLFDLTIPGISVSLGTVTEMGVVIIP